MEYIRLRAKISLACTSIKGVIIMLRYPAIFHKAIEGGYIVIFLNLDDGATEGQTLEQAMENVKVLLLERM